MVRLYQPRPSPQRPRPAPRPIPDSLSAGCSDHTGPGAGSGSASYLPAAEMHARAPPPQSLETSGRCLATLRCALALALLVLCGRSGLGSEGGAWLADCAVGARDGTRVTRVGTHRSLAALNRVSGWRGRRDPVPSPGAGVPGEASEGLGREGERANGTGV